MIDEAHKLIIQPRFNHDKLLAKFSIPVTSHVVKKNRRPIYRAAGRPFIGKSKELRSAEEHLELHLRSQATSMKLKCPLNALIWALFEFYFPHDVFYSKSTGEPSRRLPDLSNLLELPQDSLQRVGIIENDTQIHSLDLSRRLPGTEYRLDIYLLKYEDLSLV